MAKTIVGVIGASHPSEKGYAAALEVGRLIARKGWVLVCGGLGGVMEAASRGCAEEGGTVLGILPGPERDEANPFVTLPLPTNLGHARNVVIAHCAQALIAVEGEYGTLSEMAVALKLGRPVVALEEKFPWFWTCWPKTADVMREAGNNDGGRGPVQGVF
jgi:uncharacterized protein (TIGR00725 family)